MFQRYIRYIFVASYRRFDLLVLNPENQESRISLLETCSKREIFAENLLPILEKLTVFVDHPFTLVFLKQLYNPQEAFMLVTISTA